MHKHPPELLVPGTAVDVYRKPDRKDEDGWRGPAELLSLERKAASAIVRHQGQLLIIPLVNLRRHVLSQFFAAITAEHPRAEEHRGSTPTGGGQQTCIIVMCVCINHAFDALNSLKSQDVLPEICDF